MSTKIVGVDPSLTGTGICSIVVGGLDFGDGAGCHTSIIKPINKSGPERLIEIRNAASNAIQGADVVIMEGYSFGSRGAGVFQTGELGGVLRAMIHEAGKQLIEVAPTQLKKFATGKGNTKKEEVKLAVYKRWGVEFKTNDETDAFVLAKIGEALVDEAARDKLVKSQREVVDQLIKDVNKKTREAK